MQILTTGKVVVSARIEILSDLTMVAKGLLQQENVRRLETPDALVDTGATLLSLPKSMVQQLGLARHRTRTARTAAGMISHVQKYTLLV